MRESHPSAGVVSGASGPRDDRPGRWRHAAPLGVCALAAMACVVCYTGGGTALVDSASPIIRRAVEGGDLESARDRARELLAAVQATDGPESVAAARASDVLAGTLLQTAGAPLGQIRAIAEQALELKERRLGPTSLRLVPSLRNLADVLLRLGEYERARETYQRAVELATSRPGVPDPALADLLDGLVESIVQAGRHEGALPVVERALAIRQRAPDPSGRGLARTLENQARVLHLAGDYPAARPAIERALALRESGGRLGREGVYTLNLFGDQLWFEGDVPGARRFYERAASLAESTPGPMHPGLPLSLRNLAVALVDLGDPDEALAVALRAMALFEGAAGPDHPEMADYLSAVANAHQWRGDYERARALNERAAAVIANRLGGDHLLLATHLFNLGSLSSFLGDFVDAERYERRALEIWERHLGAEHPFVAWALDGLGEAAGELGRFDDARTYLERALSIRERSLEQNHRQISWTMTHLAAIHAAQGDVAGALALVTRAIASWERAATPNDPELARALLLRADLEAGGGAPGRALARYDEILAIRERVLGPLHPDAALVRARRASALARLGQPARALAEALDAESAGREHLRLTSRYLAERQALAYAARRPRGLDLMLTILAGDRAPRRHPASRRVLDAVVRSRALVLDEIAARRHAVAIVEDAGIALRREELNEARRRLANLIVRGTDADPGARYVERLEDARRRREEAERGLAAASAAFRGELARARVGLDEAQAALPAGSALVSFVRFRRDANLGPPDDHYAAFVLARGRSDPSFVPLGPASGIETLIDAWRVEATSGALAENRSVAERERSYHGAASSLRRRIWDPISPEVRGLDRVFIVPDGALNLVSFAALSASGRYLIEDGPLVHYLSTERDLVPAQSPGVASTGLLAVGGPDFDDDAEPASAAPQPVHAARGARVPCADAAELKFAPLPGSATEAREIADLWSQSRADPSAAAGASTSLTADTLIGPDATERAVIRLAPGRRILHIATHGFFLGGDCVGPQRNTRSVGGLVGAGGRLSPQAARANPLALSGLALAGANRRIRTVPDGDDGILTAEEVAALDLDGVKWAVLSACDTGIGEIRAGEGVFGLRRAFSIAGVRTVIMSLWPVEDEAARQWMTRLYDASLTRGLDTAASVRGASLEVLRSRRLAGLSTHPFYWSGFVAAGDWR
jgi:CHAT domain-containing protein/tetratricopeptide (TPR) repeat protein